MIQVGILCYPTVAGVLEGSLPLSDMLDKLFGAQYHIQTQIQDMLCYHTGFQAQVGT